MPPRSGAHAALPIILALGGGGIGRNPPVSLYESTQARFGLASRSRLSADLVSPKAHEAATILPICNLRARMTMLGLKNNAVTSLGIIGLTIISFLALNWLNELLFLPFEQSEGINWVFLPAGIRLLGTLLFGFAGFVGLLLASIYLNFYHFAFEDDARALYGAVAAAGGPYLAYLFAKHWFDLRPRLGNLTAQRLLFTGVLCGIMSPVFHHAFMWVQTGMVDWTGLSAMITGDVFGVLIVLYIAKGLITLTDPRDVDSHLK